MLSQKELEAIGAWKNPKTGRYVPVSKSTLHRVISSVDPEEIEAVLRRFSTPRLQLGRAIAVDGKRIRGANRNGDGHFETATLVEHASRTPVATLSFNDNGERDRRRPRPARKLQLHPRPESSPAPKAGSVDPPPSSNARSMRVPAG